MSQHDSAFHLNDHVPFRKHKGDEGLQAQGAAGDATMVQVGGSQAGALHCHWLTRKVR